MRQGINFNRWIIDIIREMKANNRFIVFMTLLCLSSKEDNIICETEVP